ncbi:cytochrome c, 6 heme-binding sites [Geotalea daltonii FRC-32]|uniref:Cytochrome c, 6 heme-binding sites n=1 Tax=Geotalea daltonii (strain DSM 22248 / JCM 15807 / FRC-32) TaxID=316067 RepID=B9M454_GEODF|nr:hypothetical protein [Geotalea daltonii]ACM21509.1 cytochrome c, 6 heme-binding sites [Geotalea daltonii FRC-32]
MRSSKIVLATVLLTFAAAGNALAFHEGGVAYCDGCHTMHNSSGNAKMTVNNLAPGTGNAFLLQGSDQSSTCLKCHSGSTTSSYKVATNPVPAAGAAPVQFTPGGDFSWLQKTFNATVRGKLVTSAGERHGHNVIANDFGYVADAKLTTAPGGAYPATNLTCSSCHDPHGKYRIMDAAGTTVAVTGKPINASGSYGQLPTATEAVGVYRLLAGAGYQPVSVLGNFGFANQSPIAVAPSTYNRTEDATETRVAYGQGMSEWCGNCHAGLHNVNYPTSLIHPAGNGAKFSATIVNNYNSYKASGDLTGTVATSYSSMVPYEEGTTDLATLAANAVNDGTKTQGMSTSNNVMCLSCHRAHATGWDSMTRWNNKADFLTVAGMYPGSDATDLEAADPGTHGGRTQAEVKATFYNKPATAYATFQRSLCNKCHAKD